jgi:hypothetical protein
MGDFNFQMAGSEKRQPSVGQLPDRRQPGLFDNQLSARVKLRRVAVSPAVAVSMFVALNLGIINTPDIAHTLQDECAPVVEVLYFGEAMPPAGSIDGPDIHHQFSDRHRRNMIKGGRRHHCHVTLLELMGDDSEGRAAPVFLYD